MKDSTSCPVCLKPKEKASDGFVTRFIETCQCGKTPVHWDEALSVKTCAKCGKRINQGRAGSLTQWIIRPDNCDCEVPEPTDLLTTDSEILESSGPNNVEADDEEELELSADDFPIERYKPTRFLGQGLAGRVYLCRDRFLGTQVAIKVLQSITSTSLVSFQREAKVLSSLNHANIVRILDFGVTNESKPYMVMSYIEGQTVAQLIADRRTIDFAESLLIIREVCSALSYAHGKGVFHRDIKSDNVLVSSHSGNLQAFIADFGLALAELPLQESTIFQGRTLVGTPLYMSPDQAMGRTFDARSDIYSVGCVLYEMLGGHPPFNADTAIEIMKMHAESDVPSLVADSEGMLIPNVVAGIAYKCLEKSPDNRYQSMEELIKAISRVADDPLYAASFTGSHLFYSKEISKLNKIAVERQNRSARKVQLIQLLALVSSAILLVVCVSYIVRVTGANTESIKPIASDNLRVKENAEMPSVDELESIVRKTQKRSKAESNVKGNSTTVSSAELNKANKDPDTVVPDSNFGDEDFVNLDEKTRKLDLRGTRVRTLEGISRLQMLEVLHLDKLAITDDSLRQLKGLKRLAQVSLAGTAVTIRGLKGLDDLPSLRSVMVYLCPAISKSQVLELQADSPLISYPPFAISRFQSIAAGLARPGDDLSKSKSLIRSMIQLIERKSKNATDLPHYYWCLGSWEFQTKERASSEKHLRQGLNLARSLQNQPTTIKCLIALGTLYTLTNQWSRAEDCQSQLMKVAGNSTDGDFINLSIELAGHHKAQNLLKLAASEYQQAIRMANQVPNFPVNRLAELHISLGHTYFLFNSLKEAKNELDLAFELAQKLDDNDRDKTFRPAERFEILDHLAAEYSNEANYEECLEANRAAEKIAKQYKLNDKALIKVDIRFIGLYRITGDYAKASSYIPGMMKRINGLPAASRNEMYLWGAYQLAGEVETAFQHGEQATTNRY
ncbi:MAG: protein kinase [Cyanobacteria bacterium]|nr:protein kinase [Cyanobacteriota bacterium]